jgi:hypothetical protein
VLPAHAHADDDHTNDAAAPPSLLPDGPIALTDIDRALDESLAVAEPAAAERIRAWRDDLMLAREALAYASTILAADAGILRYCLDVPTRDAQAVVDQLPRVLTARTWADDVHAASELEASERAELEVFERATPLLAAHEEMASVDLSAPEDVGRVLGLVVAGLRTVAARQDAVEVRLEEIRAAILRQYQDGILPKLDWSA